jgi:putative chitinase
MTDGFTFDFTIEQLAQLIPNNQYQDNWYEALVDILPEYEINTPLRVAAFIAQCAHESAEFTILKENLNYRWETLRKVFPKYFPNDAAAQQYALKPEAIANKVYANRMGNGPESNGDGFRYCGRGLIQLTGKENYSNFAESLDMAVEEVPEYLSTFEGALQSACWYWETNNLNQLADAGNIAALSRRINGGTIGLEDRIKHYNHACQVLGA